MNEINIIKITHRSMNSLLSFIRILFFLSTDIDSVGTDSAKGSFIRRSDVDLFPTPSLLTKTLVVHVVFITSECVHLVVDLYVTGLISSSSKVGGSGMTSAMV